MLLVEVLAGNEHEYFIVVPRVTGWHQNLLPHLAVEVAGALHIIGLLSFSNLVSLSCKTQLKKQYEGMP